MKHPAFIAGDIIDAVGKTRGQIIDWADEIEKGIAGAIAAAVEAEREACAKLADDAEFWHKQMNEAARSIATRIRARCTSPARACNTYATENSNKNPKTG